LAQFIDNLFYCQPDVFLLHFMPIDISLIAATTRILQGSIEKDTEDDRNKLTDIWSQDNIYIATRNQYNNHICDA